MTEMLQHWVAGQAGRQPDATAVVFRDERLSYGELETLSNQLARALRERGCVRGDRVCVLLPSSPLAAISLLGIYKADCVYVPLASAGAPEEWAEVMKASGSRCLLVAASLGQRVQRLAAQPGLPALRVGWFGAADVADEFPGSFRFSDISVLPGTPPASAHRGHDPAHILFKTAGENGPRGVVFTHANLNAVVNWAGRQFRLSDSERLSSQAGFSDELSLFQAFAAFAHGAELHIVPAEAAHPPQQLAAWIRRSGITQWCSKAASLHALAAADAVQPLDFPELRRVFWHGDGLPADSLGYWMRRLPHVALTRLYGPAEAACAGGWYTVSTFPDEETASLPLGRPCDGGEFLLLDQNLQPVGIGEPGDLYLSGGALSSGYWNDPETTARAFPLLDGIGRVFRTGHRAERREDGLVYLTGAAGDRPAPAGAEDIPAGIPVNWYPPEDLGAVHESQQGP